MIKIIFALLFCTGCIIYTSCKKEKETIPSVPVVSQNKTPVANAGADQIINLPLDVAVVDGSGSADPDGTILSYQWSKIAGPNSLNILNSNSAKTSINQLVQGTYLFELLVKDNGGLSAKDTMQVTVNAAPISILPGCNMSITPLGNLSIARKDMLTASAGNKILFAGGITSINPFAVSSRVDIYDMTSQTWSTAELSMARYNMSVAATGNKIFFAGGTTGGFGLPQTKRVDIYDASLNTWSTAELSVAREWIAAAAIGDKVFFAGGDESGYGDDLDIVDIYDVATNNWSIYHLSEAKSRHTATTLNNKIYFTGGYGSTKVDVYDGNLNSWSVINQSEPKIDMAAIASGNTIFWAGGSYGYATYSDNVEMYNVLTGNKTYHQLSAARSHFQAVMKNNKIVFYTGNNYPNIDVYDINNQTWSACSISQAVSGQSIISAGGKVYVAGGYLNGGFFNQVWLLDF